MKNSNDIKVNKKFSFDINTLSFRIWIYFTLFAVGIFVILWCMQVIFLQTYYSAMKKNEVNKLSSQIVNSYGKDDFYDNIDSISYRNLLSIIVIDLDGNVIYNSNENIDMLENRQLKPTMIPITDILLSMTKDSKLINTYNIKIDKFKSQMYVNARMIKDTNYCLILSTSIDPIDTTTNVLKDQLKYITIIALVISSLISIFMSKNIAKPIVKIEEKAKKLAKGEYDIKFEKCGFKEIDNLVNTLNYATKELEKTDNLRKELIANVSHDLKTPITMIKAYSEMIKDLYINDKEKIEKNLDTIIEETDRLTNLVTDMLDLSKLEANQIELKIEEIDLVEISNRIIKTFISTNKDVKLNISIKSNNSVVVNADKTKIEQVIYNLLSNAIAYSSGNKEILIQIEQKDNIVKYSVKDNGKGIDEKELPYIWDRYYRVDKNYIRSNTGTGLGLSIVRNILKKHNAKYGVESKVDVGSTFWFELNNNMKK